MTSVPPEPPSRRRPGRPLAVGIIGFGIAGRRFHAPLINAVEELEVRAIVTSNSARRSEAEARYPRARVHDSVDSLFAAAEGLGLVVVASPNQAHLEHAMRAIEAGIPVVVDKPLAGTAADAALLARAARTRGSFLTVFQNRRWDGDFLAVQRLVEDGGLGRVHRLESRFETWSESVHTNWREDPSPAAASGLLVDLGSHLIDQAVLLFGEVESVHAEMDRRRAGARVDDDGLISLRFRSGVRAHLWVSKIAAEPAPRFRLLAERGGYVKYGLDVQEEQLEAGLAPGDPGWGVGSPPVRGRVTIGTRQREEAVPAGAYETFYRSVVSSLTEGAPAPVDPEDAVYVLQVIEAARRSAAEGTAIPVESRSQPEPVPTEAWASEPEIE